MELKDSIRNQTDVSFSLAKHVISTHEQGDNFVFSPLSLHVLLALVASGSDVPARDQLLTFLKSKSTEELNSLSSRIAKEVLADGRPLGGPSLSFASGLWVDERVALKESFKQIAHNDYMSLSAPVDFLNKAKEVIKEVNAWAEKETNGLIKEILPDDAADATTMLILANAVYFKGVWNKKFDASMTKDDEFFLLNGSSVQAPFMTSYERQIIRAFDGFKVLRLPYKSGIDTGNSLTFYENFYKNEGDKRIFSMYMFLPDAKDGLPSLIDKISSEPGFFERHLPCGSVLVNDFRIPKFKIDFNFEASKVLKNQGVVSLFTYGGLSEAVDDPSVGKYLGVSKIFHKSFIEVNEQGTEAAAVSVATMGFGCSMYAFEEEPLDFVADHPFLFVIREDLSGVVLFVGQLLDPLAAAAV